MEGEWAWGRGSRQGLGGVEGEEAVRRTGRNGGRGGCSQNVLQERRINKKKEKK